MLTPAALEVISTWELVGIGITLLISAYLIFELSVALLRPPRAPISEPDSRLPFVSVVIPVYDEPPEVLRAALASWDRVRYPSFEVILADDSPVPAEVDTSRVRVIRRDNREGFKGGALRNAFRQLHPDSEWMFVFDADYVVDPDILARFSAHFRPGVGGIQGFMAMGLNQERSHLVQFSEALHDIAGTLLVGRFRHGGFVGVQGTVQAYRVEAIRSLGGIAPEFTANEDLDTTFRLRKAGWKIVYDPNIVGQGLAPDTYRAFFVQITRWTATTVREYRRHWGSFARSREVPFVEKVDSLLFLLTWMNALVVAPTFLFLPWALFVLRLIPLWLSIVISLLPFFVFMIPAIARRAVRRGLVAWLWYYILLLPGSVVMFRATLLGLFTEPGFSRTPKGSSASATKSVVLSAPRNALPLASGTAGGSSFVRRMTCHQCGQELTHPEVFFYAVAAMDVERTECRLCVAGA
jgi:cellulose synthase/poly-beta-1,6-N-acetylglucosamine synthase-like glycosyltransferase